MKKFILILTLLFTTVLLFGCSSDETTVETTVEVQEISIWVGSESKDFYQTKMNEYIANYVGDFPFTVKVEGVDTGTAASTFLDDTDVGPDIFTVAHDNLGKLIAGSSAIAPVLSEDLLAQIANDNPASFLDVIKGTVGDTTYTFGIPYIAQSLVLYYNKAYITEEQSQTWEGILEAATTANKQALSLTGTDGFNNSFILLATDASDHSTSLELYTDGIQENCFGTGDDTIAKLKWGQRFFANENGAKKPTDSGWEVELTDTADTDPISLSVIGGAWHFAAAQAALGENLGITTIPTFTLTAADAYGTATVGTTFKSGTFADTKMFVMKKGTEYQSFLEEILIFLSSKDIQEESFVAAQNLPAYKNATTEFAAFQEETLEADLATAQADMFEWGIPQPFGYASKYNTYFYSKGAPDLILAILENADNEFGTDVDIYNQMVIVESLWKTGQRPE